MNTSAWAAIAAVIVLLGVGAWWITSNPTAPAQTATDTSQTSTQTGGTTGAPGTGASVDVNATVGSAPLSAKVVRFNDGFSPAVVTIKKGGTVTWENQSDGDMWVASDEHPSHTQYDQTSRSTHCASGYTGAKPFDQCGTSAATYSFTFTKVGSFDYHDHTSASKTGQVIVVE